MPEKCGEVTVILAIFPAANRYLLNAYYVLCAGLQAKSPPQRNSKTWLFTCVSLWVCERERVYNHQWHY